MWFIGVEIEQETSTPPPKKNPGSAPASASEGGPHLSRLDFSHFPNLARARANTHFPKTAEPSYPSLNLLSFVQMCTIQPIKRLVYHAKKNITLTGISCSTFWMYNPFFNSKSFNLISESNTMNTVPVSLLIFKVARLDFLGMISPNFEH